MAKYACPGCSQAFTKWAKCKQHLLTTDHAGPLRAQYGPSMDTWWPDGIQARCAASKRAAAAPRKKATGASQVRCCSVVVRCCCTAAAMSPGSGGASHRSFTPPGNGMVRRRPPESGGASHRSFTPQQGATVKAAPPPGSA